MPKKRIQKKKTDLVPLARGFDYGAARMIRELVTKSIRGLILTGQEFLAARETVERGEFMNWVAAEGWHYKRVHRLMELAKKFGPIVDTMESLAIPASALYELAADSTPSEARQMVIDKARAGETFTVATVKDIIASFKGPAPRKASALPADRLLQRLSDDIEWIWDHHDPKDDPIIAAQLRQFAKLFERGKSG